jgi:tripeptide aminopeptidase
MELLAIEGPSGKETLVLETLKAKFLSFGANESWMMTDEAHTRLGDGFETGNLIIKFPGTIDAPRIMFSAHMDTVPICRGAVPVIQDGKVIAQGSTALGGDDRAACAAIVTLAETILTQNLPHPPITFLFVIAEENGLHGSGAVDFADLGQPVMGFNLDGESPNEFVIGAMGANRWSCDIIGRSAHAGLNPEKGISAGLIAARAIAKISERGYFGKVELNGKKGTSNVGGMTGGEASNQVMDQLHIFGECRSHDAEFLPEITEAYRTAFAEAAASVTDDQGRCGTANFTTYSDYRSFRLSEDEPCAKIAAQAIEAIGLKAEPRVINAGLDANNFNEKGFPCVTLGAGVHNFHNLEECVIISEYNDCCKILAAIVQLSC